MLENTCVYHISLMFDGVFFLYIAFTDVAPRVSLCVFVSAKMQAIEMQRRALMVRILWSTQEDTRSWEK